MPPLDKQPSIYILNQPLGSLLEFVIIIITTTTNNYYYYSITMYAKSLLIAAALSVRVTAQDSDSSCPEIWGTVAGQLRELFGDCNSNARQAIRLPFHDCFAGTCDGSIILSDECTARPENTQLVPICQSLASVAEENDVGVADLIQVAAGKHSSTRLHMYTYILSILCFLFTCLTSTRPDFTPMTIYIIMITMLILSLSNRSQPWP